MANMIRWYRSHKIFRTKWVSSSSLLYRSRRWCKIRICCKILLQTSNNSINFQIRVILGRGSHSLIKSSNWANSSNNSNNKTEISWTSEGFRVKTIKAIKTTLQTSNTCRINSKISQIRIRGPINCSTIVVYRIRILLLAKCNIWIKLTKLIFLTSKTGKPNNSINRWDSTNISLRVNSNCGSTNKISSYNSKDCSRNRWNNNSFNHSYIINNNILINCTNNSSNKWKFSQEDKS